jgi:hypothetical protein
MKIRFLMLAASFALGACALPALAMGPHAGSPVSAPPVATLSADETDTLLWMREEEKLARDVYLALDAQWDLIVLQRIAASEQRHFDALGSKVQRYALMDPALPEAGTFSDPQLQVLYQELLADGLESLEQALQVGATIEDLDILDLQSAIDATDNADLKRTYGHLLEGSKNHLRAFVRELRALGTDYAPQYIDPLLFDAIVGV